MTGIQVAVGLAVLIGASLGMLGGGGSMITMPLLVYVAGVDPKRAVVMSLAIVGATSVVGSYLHYRENNFHGKAASLFAVSGIVGAYFGGMLTHLLKSSWMMLSFGGLMLVVGTLMLVKKADLEGPCECLTWRCLVAGALLGGLTGLLGIGGGFLIVPALIFTAGVRTKQAIGSSLAIISFNSAAGLLGQLHYTGIDWTLTGVFLAASLIGMGFGLVVIRRVPPQRLRVAFACTLLVIGALVAYRNF